MLHRIRPNVRAMTGYVPGEQPQGGPVVKLNTNESPHPPSPMVLEALRTALTGERLRRYPDPTGSRFRRVASEVLRIAPDMILIGNGSDDVLTILTRAFVPDGGLVVSLTPSYPLYRNLAEIQNARFQTVPFTPDWGLPDPWPAVEADLTFLANPNSPSGTTVPLQQIERLAEQLAGPLVVDEAYADFAPENALDLVRRGKVIVTRSFSKSYAIAGLRFGMAIAPAEVIAELLKVKDSYNCDVLSLEAATAAIADTAYLLNLRHRIERTRTALAKELAALGFTVTPSSANFLWCRRSDRPVQPIYEALRQRGILIRYLHFPDYGDGLRITVGTDAECATLLEAMRSILANQ
jgi:histidinol-phosphate aminotransferase